MKTAKILLLSLVAASLWGLVVPAAPAGRMMAGSMGTMTPGGELVRIRVLPSRQGFAAGGTYPLALSLTIGKGFHINSTQPLDPHLIPTRLSFEVPEGITLSRPIFPRPRKMRVGFLDKPAEFFGGRVLVRTSINIDAGLAPGDYQVRGSLSYQACNNQMCMMPQEVSFSIPVTVTPAGRPGRRLHREIFGRD